VVEINLVGASVRIDCAYPDVKVAIEADGFHRQTGERN
jgi:hypothetical protein